MEPISNSYEGIQQHFARKWWKESVIYQIYPRSFKDSNGDGIGDINGIIEKLDHIKELGANVIWLSPVYESPNDDNGYDISDYCNIMKEFGTLEDWQRMLDEMHKRGLKLLMDLVINHTSDEHEWFKKSRASNTNNPYRDYYIWKTPKDGKEPNNWISFFGGSVWELDPGTQEYYLHLFSRKQPDLNWENPVLREELMKMIRFWLDKGVDGFRMDVINVISKDNRYPDAPISPAGDNSQGSQYYFNGPRFTEFLGEIKNKVFSKYDIFTVGEMPCVTPQHGEKYTHEMDGVCNMLFHFEMMEVDAKQGGSKWDCVPFRFHDIKKIMSQWQTEVVKGWNTLYLENHDQPRSVSRFGNDTTYRVESAKMLATWLHMLQGTPFIFQGEEIGMTNIQFKSIEDYRDIETLNMYREEMQKGIKTKDQIMDGIYKKSRDNARTPMQWNSEENGGFTAPGAKPWLAVNPNFTEINVEKDKRDPNSILNYYKKLIQLRKDHLVVVYGSYSLLLNEHDQIYAYTRTLGNEQLLVVANWSAERPRFSLGEEQSKLLKKSSCELLISNYPVESSHLEFEMKPYEARVYKLTKA